MEVKLPYDRVTGLVFRQNLLFVMPCKTDILLFLVEIGILLEVVEEVTELRERIIIFEQKWEDLHQYHVSTESLFHLHHVPQQQLGCGQLLVSEGKAPLQRIGPKQIWDDVVLIWQQVFISQGVSQDVVFLLLQELFNKAKTLACCVILLFSKSI